MGERGRGGVNPKWQSGSLCVGVDGEHIHVCFLYDCAVWLWTVHSAILFSSAGGDVKMDCRLSLHL